MNETMIFRNSKFHYLIEEDEIFNDDARHVIPCNANRLSKEFNNTNLEFDISWLKFIQDKEIKIKAYINSVFEKPQEHEGYIINQIISFLPFNSNLMVGNSSPIRDLDKFTSNSASDINIFSNRGASGIDGLISTSIGMSINNQNNNFLIIGDISFFHDVSSLINQNNINSNLIVFILNNRGGHIFDSLEGITKEKEYKDYWLTPVDLDIKSLASSFRCKYSKVNFSSIKNIKSIIQDSSKYDGIKLVEIKIDSKKNNAINQIMDEKIKTILS